MKIDDLAEGNIVQSVELVSRTASGGRVWSVRGKFRASLAAPALAAVALLAAGAGAQGEGTDNRAPAAPEGRDHAEETSELPTSGTIRIRGIASSTGVDWYGTEMTRGALESMERQFTRGTAYVPTHWESEWHEVIGETRAAEIVGVEAVDNAADPSEPQAVLWVETDIDLSHPRGRELVGAIRAGRTIGQSIGAWFTSLTFQEDSNGDLERIFVNELELDHLAATRTPANTDSIGLNELMVREVTAAIRSKAPASRTQTLTQRAVIPATRALALRGLDLVGNTKAFADAAEVDQRHIVDVTENDDGTISVTYLPAEARTSDEEEDRGTPDADAPDTPETDPEQDDRSTPTADDEPEAEEPEAADADDTTSPDSPASGEGEPEPPPHDDQESTMTDAQMAALAALIGTAVGNQIDAAFEARGIGASDTGGDTPPPADNPDDAPEKSEREQELEAQIARLTEARERDGLLVERLTHTASTRTRAFESREMLEAYTALEFGDFGPLIERAKTENLRPTVVRVATTNRKVKRVLGAFEAEDAVENRIRLRDIRESLVAVFRSYYADGGFRRPAQQWG